MPQAPGNLPDASCNAMVTAWIAGGRCGVRWRHAARGALAMETPPSPPPLPIIVVEDDPVDLYLLRRVLTAHELAHELHVIGTSDDVLAAVHRLTQPEGRRSPIILLLDLRLPQWEGKEILHQVKALPQGADVRVVIVAGSHNPADRRETLALGADAYFVKPLQLAEFMQLGALIKDVARGHTPREPSRP
jgi:CheY-like chemotaxis protein